MVKRVSVVAWVIIVSLSCGARTGSIGPAERYWLMNRACWDGDEISVQMLLKAGADPNGVSDFEAFHRSTYQRGYEPSWPINQAAHGGHVGVVRLLLRAGAKVDSPEGEGFTALTLAADRGDLEMVRVLLEAGADRSYRGSLTGELRSTPEEIARRREHREVADAIRDFKPK